MRYYFNHYGQVPRELTVAFDNRYTTARTRCMKYMERIFDTKYIVKYQGEIKTQPLTLYWPEFCKVEWSPIGNGEYQSKVVVAKTNANLTIGAEVKENWRFDPTSKVVLEVYPDEQSF